MMGMLHVEFEISKNKETHEKENYIDSRKRLIKIAADNLALSLVSLKLREALQKQSIKDPLTQLYNRRHMEESLEREIHRCARADIGLGVIMCDVDHFKQFNDTYGHDAGDAVLKAFADLLSQHFRSSDIVCRYGGEEFIVIMPEADKPIVIERANKLCEAIREIKIMYDGEPLPQVTSSFGISYIQEGIADKKVVIKAADFALYEAKQAGRNQVKVAEKDIS
jgi:diguanylate cyclase (GGDEF)-like protein